MTTVNEWIDAVYAVVKELAPFHYDHLVFTVNGPTVMVYLDDLEPSRTLSEFVVGTAYLVVRFCVPLTLAGDGQRWLNDIAASTAFGEAIRSVRGAHVERIERRISSIGGTEIHMDDYRLKVTVSP